MIKGFTTKALHGSGDNKDSHKALRFPVYDGASFEFDSSKDIADAFAKRKPAHAYSRITNPTIADFEERINLLAGGLGTIALSSGMAAITNLIFAIGAPGSNIVTTDYLFGNTYTFLNTSIKRWGLEARKVNFDDPDEVARAIDDKTVAVFVELVANPQMRLFDIEAIGRIAADKGVVFVVDSTLCTPYLFKAADWGVNVEVLSSTKYISGGGTSVGGLLIDHGNFNWGAMENFKQDYKLFGKFSLIKRLRDEIFRNLGACLSPHNAYLQSLGLETMALRIDRSTDNALKVARFLSEQDQVAAVNHPALSSHRDHERQKKLLPRGIGGLFTFNLESQEACFQFMDRLKVIRRATNLNDNKSLIIHPASTIYCDMPKEVRERILVPDNLIRLSVGIEDPEDLIEDISQALKLLHDPESANL